MAKDGGSAEFKYCEFICEFRVNLILPALKATNKETFLLLIIFSCYIALDLVILFSFLRVKRDIMA